MESSLVVSRANARASALTGDLIVDAGIAHFDGIGYVDPICALVVV